MEHRKGGTGAGVTVGAEDGGQRVWTGARAGTTGGQGNQLPADVERQVIREINLLSRQNRVQTRGCRDTEQRGAGQARGGAGWAGAAGRGRERRTTRREDNRTW